MAQSKAAAAVQATTGNRLLAPGQEADNGKGAPQSSSPSYHIAKGIRGMCHDYVQKQGIDERERSAPKS